MRELTKHIDTECGRLGVADRALAFGRANLRCLAGFAASIADAKNPCAEIARGGNAVGGTGASILGHSGTPHQHPHLRPL